MVDFTNSARFFSFFHFCEGHQTRNSTTSTGFTKTADRGKQRKRRRKQGCKSCYFGGIQNDPTDHFFTSEPASSPSPH